MRNSSSEPAPEPRRVRNFVYHDWESAAGVAGDEAAEAEFDDYSLEGEVDGLTIPESEVRLREEAARRQGFEQAKGQLGGDLVRQVEQNAQENYQRQLELERAAIVAALRQFQQQRREYFAQLEREVVGMVMAIARKVLHREARLDPLLLAGAVRVALEPLSEAGRAELVVPPSQLEFWKDWLERELTFPPKLRGEAQLEPYGCRLETAIGSADLSLDSQVVQIEQAFLDLLQRRTRLMEEAPMPSPEEAPESQ